jgi:predicted HTH transcriptional regulator
MSLRIIENRYLNKLLEEVNRIEDEGTGILVGGISNYISENKIDTRYDNSIRKIIPKNTFYATIRDIEKEKKVMI